MSDYALSLKQRRTCIEFTSPVNIAMGAVRSGKTEGVDIRWMQIVRQAPPGVSMVMIGKTERTLKRNVLNPIIEKVGSRRAKFVSGEGEFWLFGRRIYVVGANDVAAETKIRGMTLYAAYCDEITIWPEGVWKMLLTRMSEPGAIVVGTTNPGPPTHWLKLDIDRAAYLLDRDNREVIRGDPRIDSTTLNWTVHDYKLEDNEWLMRVNPAYVDNLKRTFTGLWYRRFIRGEWVAADGAVYPMFDLDRHVVDAIPPIKLMISEGIDYGTTNPTAGVALGIGEDDRLYLVSEWAPTKGASDAQLVQQFRAWRSARRVRPTTKGADADVHYTFVDPAGASLKKELRLQRYPRITNGDNAVTEGLRQVGALLDRDLLRIHRSCENTINEIGGYVWDDKAAERGDDKPLKVNDHWCDAMRYAIYSSRKVWIPRLNYGGQQYAHSQA